MAKNTSLQAMIDFMLYESGTSGGTDYYTFNPAQSVITYNVEGLRDYGTPEQVNAAIRAFDAWHDTTGLVFQRVAGTANITLDNSDSSGAYETNVSSDDIGWTTRAHVNVPVDWMDDFVGNAKWGIGSYGYQTFIHEIGHALGLNHPGKYDASQGDFTYADAAQFVADTVQFSVMSYFDQSDRTSSVSKLNLNTPQLLDIEAIRQIYALNDVALGVNPGNTLYGKGETAYNGLTDFGRYGKSVFTISDTGGIDTWDLSNVSKGSLIDLRAGNFSSVNGFKGNVAIAYKTVIENVKGTAGADTIYGNAAANAISGNGGADKISGGAGRDILSGGTTSASDVFIFTAKTDSGTSAATRDLIKDFQHGIDDINLHGIDARSATASINDDFTFQGKTASFGGAGSLHWFQTGGMTIVEGDTNGDGRADFSIALAGTITLDRGDFVL